MIPRKKHLRRSKSSKLHGSGVVGIVQQAPTEGILFGRERIGNRAWNETHDGIHDHHRRKLATRQYVVSNRQFLGSRRLEETLVDAFIAAGHQN